MRVQPLSSQCLAVYQEKTHICFGVSPFNSYFSASKLETLARWGFENFSSLHFFIPDLPSVHTLEALGYDPAKAAWKARRQCQYLKNKVVGALKNCGVKNVEDLILDWEYLTKKTKYLEFYESTLGLYANNLEFRKNCLDASRWVLEKRVADSALLTEEALSHAVKYFLAEIPLFANTPEILGIEASVFGYHQSIPFMEKLYGSQMLLKPSPNQGYLVLEELSEPEVSICVK